MVALLRFFLSRFRSWAEAEGLLEVPRGRTELYSKTQRPLILCALAYLQRYRKPCSSAICATPPGGATHGRSDPTHLRTTNFPRSHCAWRPARGDRSPPAPPAPAPPPRPPPTPLRIGRSRHRGQQEARYARGTEKTGHAGDTENVAADAAQSVSRDHRNHGQAANEEGSHPCDYCYHGVTLSCEDVHA